MKRHFRELKLDPATEPFSAWVGDMSGDVFGNGMLYSDASGCSRRSTTGTCSSIPTRIPPRPSPSGSDSSRRRARRGTTTTGRSCPKGGDVIDRGAKWVTLSPQVRAALAIPDDAPAELTPADVIRWLLQAPADLLWNGGIGTHCEGDGRRPHGGRRSRERPGARERNQVRARVVGEGGNLGFTQRGRIEYARAGGRINTDFIDNSAGVDTSDHEVNLKILLGLAVERGELTVQERNDLLQACTDDVVRRVLYDNHLQPRSCRRRWWSPPSATRRART